MEKAKEMFMAYGGSHFFMDREGDLKKYKSFNISREKEIEWIAEYRKNLETRMLENPTESNTVSEYCRTIQYYEDYPSIRIITEKVKQIISQLDSFSKVRYAEELLRTIESLHGEKHQDLLKEVHQTAITLLQEVVDYQVTVAPNYKKSGYLKDTLKHDKIIERARENIKRINSQHL